LKKKKELYHLLVQPKNKAAYIPPGTYPSVTDAVKGANGYAISGECLFTVYKIMGDFTQYDVGWLRRTPFNEDIQPENPFNNK
jgi:hypothetical protein